MNLSQLTLNQIASRIANRRNRARVTRLIIALAVVAGIALATVGATTAEPLSRPHTGITTSLISYWKLDEASGTRFDELNGCGGSGCDLTDNNTVTQATGKLGNAGQFTSANTEYLSRSDDADLSTGNIDFTVAAWAYLDTKSANMQIVSKYTATGNQREYALMYEAGSDRFRFEVDSTGAGALTNVLSNNFGAPSTGTWYFVVAKHDAANDQLSISVNAGTPNTTSTSAGVFDSTSPFFIGNRSGALGPWNGRIDAVGFWKRALSASEISCLYNSGAGLEYPFTGCDPTATPTNTATVTATPTFTASPTVTNTPIFTDTPTATATVTDTPVFTSTFTDTPTSTFTNTPTPTDTPGPTNTPTPTETLGPTPTPTPTATTNPDCTNPLYECHTLSSGNLFVVERRMTYGEIAVSVLGIALLAAYLLKWAYEFTVRWLYPDTDQRRAMQDDE